MSKPFTLSLERVHCGSQTWQEWGSDEMYLVGFGISRGGDRFTIKPVSLGSFSAGDTSSSGYPKSLVDIQVRDDESLVSTCVWLFERDSGDLADAGNQLEADFNTNMDAYLGLNDNLGLSLDARQYYAFGQAMHSMQFDLQVNAESVWNADDLWTGITTTTYLWNAGQVITAAPTTCSLTLMLLLTRSRSGTYWDLP
jgi:hypothetical protein